MTADDDPVERRLRDLAERTRQHRVPQGLEERALARLRAHAELPGFWEVAWQTLRRSLPIAACAAAIMLVLAIWQDRRAAEAITTSQDAIDFEARLP